MLTRKFLLLFIHAFCLAFLAITSPSAQAAGGGCSIGCSWYHALKEKYNGQNFTEFWNEPGGKANGLHRLSQRCTHMCAGSSILKNCSITHTQCWDKDSEEIVSDSERGQVWNCACVLGEHSGDVVAWGTECGKGKSYFIGNFTPPYAWDKCRSAVASRCVEFCS